MSSYTSGERRFPPNSGYDRNGRMYDDRTSRSRSRSYSPSREYSRSRDRRYGSSSGPRSPSHDISRTPPRGPAADRRFNSSKDEEYRRGRGRSPGSPRRWRGRSGYRDRDREGYRSPRYDSRSRSRSRSRSHGRSRSRSPRRRRPPHYGTESREVIMEGLPVDMNEDDISNELTQYYHVEGLEEVRVIRDRQTKISRQLGFLRFRSLDYSREFLGRNFPAIYLYGNDSSQADNRGTKVRIAYSREREDRYRSRAEGEWTCANCTIVNYPGRQKCFRCQAPRSEYSLAPQPAEATRPVNTGDNDVTTDGTPSQFLLLRGLEPSVTEEVLAKGVAKLYRPAPSAQTQGGNSTAKKGAKVASTTEDSNLGARDGSLRRVLLVRDRRSNESWRYGFAEFATVADAQAAIARYNSFETFTISSKPVLASYIHAGVFVPVLNPTPSIERFTFSPLGNPSMKLAYWDEDAYVTELIVSTADLDAKPKAETEKSKSTKDSEKPKKRKADSSSSTGTKKLAVPSHLQFWSDRHAELHGIQRKKEEESAAGENETSTPQSKASESPQPTQSYADLDRMCCYLCMRQFKSAAEVNRHERLSQLHRDNLQNEELKTKALAKLAKKRGTPEQQQSSTEYRDRAKERRLAFGSSNTKAKDKSKPVSDEEGSSAPSMSKGAALLGKMGWSAGTGLGAKGTGMTAPISQEIYVQGVGLGAQGGKVGDALEEASRNTRGRYDEFLEKTKENARERYEQLTKEGR